MVDFNKLMAEAKAKREAAGGTSPLQEAKVETKAEAPAVKPNFMQQLAAKAATKTAVEERPIGIPEVAPIPKVITAANLANKATEGQSEAEVTGETKEALERIRQKIHDIQTMNDGELNGAMTTLREMLRVNPAACSLMLPEDVGLTVRALRRMTGNTQALSLVNARGSKKAGKEKDLSPEEILKLASETNLDDWG